MKHSIPLIDVLKDLYPDSSNAKLKGWIKQKRVLVDSSIASSPLELVNLDTKVRLTPKKIPMPGNLEIIYQDSDLVVVNKPTGLLSVDSDNPEDSSVHSLLKRHFFKKRVLPVHRLDRETSGLLIFALSRESQTLLKEQFLNRSISRNYFAIIKGHLEDKNSQWKDYLEESKSLKMVASTEDKGKLAITNYRVIHETKNLSALDIALESGRKNQIRAQCLFRGHPILGDKKYGDVGSSQRMALHAYSLKFMHPIKKKNFYFLSPIPRELQACLDIKVIIDEKTLSLQVG